MATAKAITVGKATSLILGQLESQGFEYQSEDLEGLVARFADKFVKDVLERVLAGEARATTPVDPKSRQAGVLRHHGIDPKSVMAFEVDKLLLAIDHTTCPTTGWSETEQKVVRGCPVAGRPRLIES